MHATETTPPAPALVVDLDGTLVRSDLLHEAVFGLLRLRPLDILRLPLWLMRGKAHVKQQIADRVPLRADLLPWHTEFLDYLRAQQAAGRRLILATASNERYAEAVSEELGLFDGVIASSPELNMSGANKLARIRAELGDAPFSYAGNADVDMPIWQAAKSAVLVSSPGGVARRARAATTVEAEFAAGGHPLADLLRAMRPHQWLKNFLIFIPLILSQQLHDTELLLNACLAFVAFSMCASSVYLLNDLLDLVADRQHPTKRHRPFASGRLSIPAGIAAKIILLLCALLIAFSLPQYFLYVLVLYYGMTMAYSLWLKKASLIDGLVLAGLYTLRLIAGAAAIAVAPTFWLLAFSMFIFLSLAFIKRYSELLHLHGSSRGRLAGRAYRAGDQETLAQLGTASGYLAVLVLAFYINSDAVTERYARPEALWLLCPILLYWVSRMWLLTRRGEMDDDPVVFTIRDMRTWWLALFAGLSLFVAIFWPELRPYLPLVR